MNLLFYVPQMAPFGGIERHVCGLARAAAAEGHHVRFITTSNSLGAELRGTLTSPLIIFRELPSARGRAGAVRKAIWLFGEVLQTRDRTWDIIYTNGQSALARVVWLAAGRTTRIVHHHHNSADVGEQRTWSRPFRRLLAEAPELVACSHATRQALNLAVRRTDVRFLPYLAGSPVESSQVSDRAPGRPLRFGFCGRLIPEKGIDAILALADDPELSDIEWHIHGSGDAFPPERFSQKPRVVFHGAYRSPTAHANALLALDSLVLFSTHNEGMPLSLIEGMSAGLPWVATDRGGTRELASSESDTLIAPADATVNQLGTAVRTLANRIISRNTSRRLQRAVYDRRFSPPVVTAQWLQFFQHPSA